jgi:hypothetical protein
MLYRFQHVRFCNVPSADVVQPPIVGFTYNGIYRLNIFISLLLKAVLNHALDTGRHAEGVGQDHGGLKISQLPHLRSACQFSEAVAYINSGGYFFLKDISIMREDGGYACTHRCTGSEGNMPYKNASNICDGIQLSRLKHTDPDAMIPRPFLFLRYSGTEGWK